MPEGDTTSSPSESPTGVEATWKFVDYFPPLIGGRKYTSESARNGS
jgi:hypothetical protein